MGLIYKIVGESECAESTGSGRFEGSASDRSDGFIHLSAADQVAETARRHFAGRTDLVLVAVDADALGDALIFEQSRGGKLFPHLYGPLPLAAVRWVRPLPATTGEPTLDLLE